MKEAIKLVINNLCENVYDIADAIMNTNKYIDDVCVIDGKWHMFDDHTNIWSQYDKCS